jgi:rod shape-determining protein MreD
MAGHRVTVSDAARSTLVIVVAVVLQHTLVDTIRVDGAHPDLMILLPVAAGYSAGPERGAVFGFVAGLVADLFLPTTFGLSALVGCLLGFGTGFATQGLVRSSWWLAPLTATAATAAGLGGYAILGAVLGDPAMVRVYLAPALAVVTPAAAVLAVPAVRVLSWALPTRQSGPRVAGGGSPR